MHIASPTLRVPNTPNTHAKMGDITIPCKDYTCTVEGADVADHTCSDNIAPSGSEDEQNGSQKASDCDHNSDATTGTSTSDVGRDVGAEGSEAVRLLDEELVELEKLVSLQRRRIDALERLRRQWISGERCRVNRIYYFLYYFCVFP